MCVCVSMYCVCVFVIFGDGAVQVDREERPDVDQCFMTFVQATSGGGGWPMSVWLTPDLTPFVGATYFPERRFIEVLEMIAEKWDTERCAHPEARCRGFPCCNERARLRRCSSFAGCC